MEALNLLLKILMNKVAKLKPFVPSFRRGAESGRGAAAGGGERGALCRVPDGQGQRQAH